MWKRRGYNQFADGYGGGYNWPSTFAPPPPPPAIVHCGELRRMDVGKIVEISGRLHKLSQERFIQLKDGRGITQLVIPIERSDLHGRFKNMPLNSLVAVLGEVQARPLRGLNEKMATGDVEVLVEDILKVETNKWFDNKLKNVANPRYEPPTDEHPPKITSEEYHKFRGLLSKLNERKYTCGDLAHKIGELVNLTCWVDKSSQKFITLVDGYGKIQCVVPSQRDDIVAVASHLIKNAVVVVSGKIRKRPPTQINSSQFNGHIEFHIESLEWLTTDENDDTVMAAEEGSVLGELTMRTHACGELTAEHAGTHAVLCGWLRYLRLNRFLQLRDAYGTVQCVLPEQWSGTDVTAVPLESVVRVAGTVTRRPPGAEFDSSSGEVELLIQEFQVLNEATKVPFLPKPNHKPNEIVRLQHRFMELRRPELQANLRLRSRLLQNMRNLLVEKMQFIEIDTPVLTVPGVGALRVKNEKTGVEYGVWQHPQLHMLLLATGAVDRCFQISKTFLSSSVEGQVEGTRLHLAMCFSSQSDMMGVAERLLAATWPAGQAPPFPHITHDDAMRTYGSTAPDVSYDLKLQNVTSAIENAAETPDFAAYALAHPQRYKFTSAMKTLASTLRSKYESVTLSLSVGHNRSAALDDAVRKLTGHSHSVLAFGNHDETCLALGELRAQLATDLSILGLLKKNDGGKTAWVTAPPMFSGGSPPAHSFAAAHTADAEVALSDPLKARAEGFSLVTAGAVLGTGCVGCSDPRLLQKQLTLAGVDDQIAENLLNAVRAGCPPYTTISLDIDKLVTLACEAESVRDTTAFPRLPHGQDTLSVKADESLVKYIVHPKGEKEDTGEPSLKLPKLK